MHTLFGDFAEGFTIETEIGQDGSALMNANFSNDAFVGMDVFGEPLICLESNSLGGQPGQKGSRPSSSVE